MPNDNRAPQDPRQSMQPRTDRAAGMGAKPAYGPAQGRRAGQPAGASAAAGNSTGAAGGKGLRGKGVKGAAGGPGKPGGSGTGAAQANKRTILLVLGCVVAALLVWILVWFFACNGGGLFDPNAQSGQAPYKSDAEMQAELNRQVEEGMFNISIASVIQFDDGAAPGTAYIENVPNNHYLMKVTITDDSSGDVLYESGILKPDQYIEQITLTKDLGPGTYAATATFTALDQTTYDEVGKAAAKVTLNVLG